MVVTGPRFWSTRSGPGFVDSACVPWSPWIAVPAAGAVADRHRQSVGDQRRCYTKEKPVKPVTKKLVVVTKHSYFAKASSRSLITL